MGVKPLTLMGDVTKTEFLLTIYIILRLKKDNFYKTQLTCRVPKNWRRDLPPDDDIAARHIWLGI